MRPSSAAQLATFPSALVVPMSCPRGSSAVPIIDQPRLVGLVADTAEGEVVDLYLSVVHEDALSFELRAVGSVPVVIARKPEDARVDVEHLGLDAVIHDVAVVGRTSPIDLSDKVVAVLVEADVEVDRHLVVESGTGIDVDKRRRIRELKWPVRTRQCCKASITMARIAATTCGSRSQTSQLNPAGRSAWPSSGPEPDGLPPPCPWRRPRRFRRVVHQIGFRAGRAGQSLA